MNNGNEEKGIFQIHYPKFTFTAKYLEGPSFQRVYSNRKQNKISVEADHVCGFVCIAQGFKMEQLRLIRE